MSLIRLDYYLYVPGNLTDLSSEISFKNENKKLNGSVSSIYILSIYRPTILEYAVSKLVPYKTLYYLSKSYVESYDDELDNAIGNFDSDNSFNNAYVAANSLLMDGMTFKEVSYIYSAYEDIISNISYTYIVGQMITGFEENVDSYPTVDEVTNYMASKLIGEEAILYLENNDGVKNELKITKNNDGMFGISIIKSYIAPVNNIEVNNVYTQGPSGGAMQALYIYLNMIDEDLLKGRKVSGTGTISYGLDEEGNVSTYSKIGAIGCIHEKLFAAYMDNCDVFYCPKSNYAECMKSYYEYLLEGYDLSHMRVVEVSDLTDIIDDLREDY